MWLSQYSGDLGPYVDNPTRIHALKPCDIDVMTRQRIKLK